MTYQKGVIEEITTYKGYKIVIEHDWNSYIGTKEDEFPVYTICGLGRCCNGPLKDVKKFINNMFKQYV